MMNQYVTGTMIKRLREDGKMTQQELAELFSGEDVTNTNSSFNMQRTKVHVCPI